MVKYVKFLWVLALFSGHFSYAAAPLAEEVETYVHYINKYYNPILEDLKSGIAVTRKEICDLYEKDPSLEREHAGGHDQFKHKHFPMTFGVVSRHNMQLPPDERKDTTRMLQIYVNVIRSIVKYNRRADEEGKFDWREALRKYEEVDAKKFQELMREESGRYEEYSRK
jgi:hypothetical protein